jgi:hypothetical protein
MKSIARQKQTLSRQKAKIQTLTTALTDRSKQQMLVSQAKCSEAADKFLSNRHYERTDGLAYENHFNAKMNKCFVLISDYDIKADLLLLNVFDAVEGKHYAEFVGHNVCDVNHHQGPRKCFADSGHIWFDGNDTRNPSDFTVGFRGLRFGGGAGDENTLPTFRDHVRPFMKD